MEMDSDAAMALLELSGAGAAVVPAEEALAVNQHDEERDPDRFYCPFPKCKRSFAELWRLKVHYRCDDESAFGLGGSLWPCVDGPVCCRGCISANTRSRTINEKCPGLL